MSVSPCDREGPWHSKITLERSPIYALPALGEDRDELESLTSYLQRLSFSLNLFCGDLINHILLPRVTAHIKASSLRACKVSHSLNGSGKYANAFEQALSEIWPNQSLPKPATFSFLTPLIGDVPRRLVSEYLQWCPACLKEQNGEYFFPLYWQSSLSHSCTTHKLQLTNRCHVCNKGIRQIVSINYPGICPYCGTKLEDAPLKKSVPKELFYSEQIRLLIKSRDELKCNDINHNWMSFIKTLACKSRNISKLEATLGLCDTQLSQWIRRSRPELLGVLKLSKSVKINVADILLGSPLDMSFDDLGEITTAKSKVSLKRSKLEVESIRRSIRASIDIGLSTSLKAAAKNAGVSTGFIDYHFPDLAAELKVMSAKTARQAKKKFNSNLQNEINKSVQSYFEINHIFPSVNQVKDILSSTPGNSTISLAHLLVAKNTLRSRQTQSFEGFRYSFSRDHNYESNIKGGS